MPLLQIHKIMIGTAVVFCALFGWRCWALGEVRLGTGATVAAVGLAIYLRWFLRTQRVDDSGGMSDDREL
jgi:hypothetical protein